MHLKYYQLPIKPMHNNILNSIWPKKIEMTSTVYYLWLSIHKRSNFSICNTLVCPGIINTRYVLNDNISWL